MVNVNKLKAKMVELGTNVDELSEKIGMDRATFYRRLSADGQTFLIKEADAISKELGMTREEVNEIFLVSLSHDMRKGGHMNEVLKINYETEQPTVSARELHEALGVASRFSRWFDSNKELFVEGEDYNKCTSSTVVNNGARRELEDYSMSVLMAKHICLMSRTEKGKRCRDYLIDLEKAWNTPEQIMARALKMANHSIESLKGRCKFLGEQVVEQQQIITELQPKANYVDMILQSKSLVTITQIAKDYGMSGRKLNKILKELKIQYKVGGQWVLYSKYQNGGYVHSRTIDITRTDGRADVTMQTEWTQKGRLFLYEELKKHGYVPVIEQAA